MLDTAGNGDTMSYLHITAMKSTYALWVGWKGEGPACIKPRCANLRDQARVFAYTHYT